MRAQWVFDGGRPCLDLVNTLRDRHGSGRELLVGPAELTEWLLLAGFLHRPARASQRDLQLARDLREAIDRVTLAVSAGERPALIDVRLINRVVATPAPVPELRIAPDGRPYRKIRPPAQPVAAALAGVAADAIAMVTTEPEVRVCAGTDCGLRFLDTSPQRNRQWCSMSRCGNRAKVRAHYARRNLAGTS
ncbi:MAG TPA: CGNR zinc finger domain-containing protein [Amycolatopsis sp.]|jgi:predicted RNA-binding Zn ribbon-like protein|nr:CGNR zinc finger domain-containing protein [Amycolatopsis sp.]